MSETAATKAGRGERAPDAAGRGDEALAELEDRVDVSLAWVREQEGVDAVLCLWLCHGWSITQLRALRAVHF
jgi:hypothetical protein